MAYVGGTSSSETLYGTDGEDGVYGFDGNDALYGLGGHDHVGGQGGDDALIGGFGADHLYGGAGIDIAHYFDSDVGVAVRLDTGHGFGGTAEGDTLFDIENLAGSAWDDYLIGNDGGNELYGLAGNDLLKGGGGADVLYGAVGNDTLKGGGGADSLYGGAGIDTAAYADAPAAVMASLDPSVWFGFTAGDAFGDTFSSIENLTGSSYGDTLVGDGHDNVLNGLNGNDQLAAGGGHDVLQGGAGADRLHGGAGNDAMAGGADNDTYFVEDASDAVTEYGGQGVDQVFTSVSWTLTAGADVETLRTTNDAGVGAINLTGNSSGNDIIGNAGNNVIGGGDGDDYLTGLAGRDSFLFDTAPDAASNIDVITDFSVEDDTVLLDDAVFADIGLGTLAGSQFAIGAASDANHRIIYDDATGDLFYDRDGTGGIAAIRFAELSPGLGLTNVDFFITDLDFLYPI
jgi:Ca2+-binding RTX toxin-like protein